MEWGPLCQLGPRFFFHPQYWLSSSYTALLRIDGNGVASPWLLAHSPLLSEFSFGVAYPRNELPAPIRLQTEYAGLRLGMTHPEEVMYVKGYPPTVEEEEAETPEWKGFFKSN